MNENQHMPRSELRNNIFIYSVTFLCLAYLLFELIFNSYSMLSVDEFWFAHKAYQYKEGIPYRDFAPYKTVLGYYLLLIPLLLHHGVVGTLIFTKNAIACVNSLILFVASLWLTRFFSRSAVLASLALLLTTEIMLSYSTNIRVDLFAYWCCLFAILLMLEKKYFCSGILIGIGFTFSQKAIWYLLAANGALGIQGLLIFSHLQTLRQLGRFNIGALIVIATYSLFWIHLADFQVVIDSIFYEASTMYHLDWYGATRYLFWSTILQYNPLLFLLCPLTSVSLLVTYPEDTSYSNRLLIIIYTVFILSCLTIYKQIFPYYMQVILPIFLILYSVFFTWILEIYRTQHLNFIIQKKYILALLFIYSAGIAFTLIKMSLPLADMLICCIPFSLSYYFYNQSSLQAAVKSLTFTIIGMACFFMGSLFTLPLFAFKFSQSLGEYQQANMVMLDQLLHDGSDYIAGIELLYTKSQPIAGMKHLMGPAIHYLYHPSPKLRAVMLSSLDEDPSVDTANVITALKTSTVKAYVNNYRLRALPAPILTYLANQYDHWWGSIYLYAPKVPTGNSSIDIRFKGNYLIVSEAINTIHINNKRYIPRSTIRLAKQKYTSKSTLPYRLKLIPQNISLEGAERFQSDQWQKLTL